jgi:N-methylhydantoinase A
MRYVGQEHAVTVDLPTSFFAAQDRDAIKRHFDALHEVRYGTCAPKEAAELVSLRVTVTGTMAKPPRAPIAAGAADATPRSHRAVFFRTAGGFVETPIHDRTDLAAGQRIAGPALVEEHASTTVLAPGDMMLVDDYGNLDIAIGSDRS